MIGTRYCGHDQLALVEFLQQLSRESFELSQQGYHLQALAEGDHSSSRARSSRVPSSADVKSAEVAPTTTPRTRFFMTAFTREKTSGSPAVSSSRDYSSKFTELKADSGRISDELAGKYKIRQKVCGLGGHHTWIQDLTSDCPGYHGRISQSTWPSRPRKQQSSCVAIISCKTTDNRHHNTVSSRLGSSWRTGQSGQLIRRCHLFLFNKIFQVSERIRAVFFVQECIDDGVAASQPFSTFPHDWDDTKQTLPGFWLSAATISLVCGCNSLLH
jgi:hypothetical protein